MKYIFYLLLLCCCHVAAESAPHTIAMGDGSVNGTTIGEYETTWQQCALQEGSWIDAGAVTERTVIIGSHLRHRQSTVRPDGVRSVATTYFDHASLSPLRMELEVNDADGNLLATSERDLDKTGYTGVLTRREQQPVPLSGSLSSTMYHGAVLGLPLATLDYAHERYRLEASMMMFDARYDVIVTSAGTEELVHGDSSYAVELVDVEWLHDNGEVYPPGPDGSGGRYWLLRNTPEDLPHVIRYKTDTYAVEFLPQVCGQG